MHTDCCDLVSVSVSDWTVVENEKHVNAESFASNSTFQILAQICHT